jgi:protein gp37
MRDLLNGELSWAARLPHVWWGVSVEDRKYGVPRIEHLRQTKASMRFLSIEPLLEDLGEIDLRGIHWVIVGGESGAGCRPLKEAWVVSLRDQCRRARVPFFFKQWGGFPKKVAGRTLKGKTWDAMPSRPEVEVLDTNERELLIKKAAAVAARWTAPERERSIASAP